MTGLLDCYRDCRKYETDIRRCLALCDALWGDTGGFGEGDPCFPRGSAELRRFKDKYNRIGRLGFEDWQIVSEVIGIVSTMLDEGGRGCPNPRETIVKVVSRSLDELGIDRYSIYNAYLHGVQGEIREIITQIFPNIGKTEDRNHVAPTSTELSMEPSMIVNGQEKAVNKARVELRHSRAKFYIALALGSVSSMTWLGALLTWDPTLMDITVVLAAAVLALKPNTATGIWFTTTLIPALVNHLHLVQPPTAMIVLLLMAIPVELAKARGNGAYRKMRLVFTALSTMVFLTYSYLSISAVPQMNPIQSLSGSGLVNITSNTLVSVNDTLGNYTGYVKMNGILMVGTPTGTANQPARLNITIDQSQADLTIMYIAMAISMVILVIAIRGSPRRPHRH